MKMEKNIFFIVIKLLIVSSVMGELLKFCKPETAQCSNNSQCCSGSCRPKAFFMMGFMMNICKSQKLSEPLQCIEIGISCTNSSECCSNYCRLINSSVNGLCDSQPKAPLTAFKITSNS